MHWEASGYGLTRGDVSIAQPLTTWYLAEGATIGGFWLFYLLQNAERCGRHGDEVHFLLPAPKPPIVKVYPIKANSRAKIWVNYEDPVLAAAEVSAVMTLKPPIIVERAMYLDAPGQVLAAGHESAGVPAPATRVDARRGRDRARTSTCSYLIANPNDATAQLEVRLPAAWTARSTPGRTPWGPKSRFNIWVDMEGARSERIRPCRR